MADQTYFSVFTKKGLELLTEAIRNGTKLGITHMAFGDGGGSLPVPNENFTKLVNEVHRTQLNSLSPDPNNANWLRAEAIIASAIGGFNIRELGLYAGTTLVAYSNYPTTYKPNPSDGTARIMTFRMVLQIDNTASFELKIDPDIVLATIASVNEAKQELYENTATFVPNKTALAKLIAWQNRNVYVKGDGHYYYSQDQNNWVKDFSYNVYDFKHSQPVQYYYEVYKDWDEAIFQAQLAIYTKKYSEKLLFPRGVIKLKRPILHGGALGDYIHARYPELNFYDENTQGYKAMWALILYGVNGSFRDGVDLVDEAIANDDIMGTQFVFCGCKDANDKTFMNKAIIYSGCTNYLDNRFYDKGWLASWIDVRNINIDCNNQDNSKYAMIHGLYAYHGNHVYLEKVVVYRLWGGGIVCDLTYDSRIIECKILRCGRMIGTQPEFAKNPINDIAYQTYAPLHIMNSAVSVGDDDNNFIRVIDCQIEDNSWVVADVIISDASPTWFSRNHFECQADTGPINTNKTVFCLGKWGVKYFGRDSEADFVGNEDTGVGGSAIIEGGSMFADCYSYLARVHRFSNIAIDKWLDPQYSSVVIDGGDAAVHAVISNSTLGSVTVGGGLANTYPLRMTNTKLFGDLSFDYVGSSIVDNVIIEGNLSFKNTATEASRKNPFKLDVVVKGKVTGYPQYVTGRINAQSINGFYPYNTDIHLTNIDEYNELIGAK